MKIQTPEAFEFLYKPKRHKSAFGGRGSAKSWAFADALIVYAAQCGDSALCAREFQNSIEDSVHGLLTARIKLAGLEDAFDVQSTAIYHRTNGAQFKYAGLSRNITSIKSKFGYKRIWLEEAETIRAKSWEVLIPTFREGGSEIWSSWNPDDEMSATYQQLVKPWEMTIRNNGFYEDEHHYIKKVSWRENPWFKNTPLYHEMLKCKETNYKKYLHIWEGECNADYEDSIIEPEWVEAAIDSHIKLGINPRGDRVTSFDPADVGKDAKAIANRYGILVKDVVQWTSGDLETAIGKAFDAAFDFRADCMVYDSIGVGAGVRVGLSERINGRRIEVAGFGGADSVDLPDAKYQEDRTNRDTFKNKRAQYWWLLRDRFEKTYRAVVNREYIDPDELISLSSEIKDLPQLKSELVRQQRKRVSSSRLIQLVSKEEMRTDGIPSPNMADAVVMCFANPPKPKAKPQAIPIANVTHWR